jgi:short-subunit dehydrogenase
MRKFKNKVVWITGASSGIGASLAKQLNTMGATVVASGRRAERLTELQKECPYPQNLVVLPLDITDPASIRSATLKVEQLNRLDLLIHNAGIAQKGRVIENHMDIDRMVMETNYFGTVSLTKAIMPLYLKQGFGRFAVMSSFAGVMGIPSRSAYAASKHALHGFFESLEAEDMSCKLRVSYIIPGFINTQITAKGLRGDGRPNGQVETSHSLGISADSCANNIIRGLRKNKRRIVVGRSEVGLLLIRRISPGLSRYIIRNHPMRRMRRLKAGINRFFYGNQEPVAEGQLSKGE